VRELSSLPKRIESGDEAEKIDGIGKKLAKKIDEILTTGSLKKLEKMQADELLAAMRLVSRVSGVGPSAGTVSVLSHTHTHTHTCMCVTVWWLI
jgi:DNA polymerase/3'-5' exonuclease PolX